MELLEATWMDISNNILRLGRCSAQYRPHNLANPTAVKCMLLPAWPTAAVRRRWLPPTRWRLKLHASSSEFGSTLLAKHGSTRKP